MPDILRLSDVEPGRKVKLAYINAGKGLKVRLASMGLVPNVEIVIVSSGRPGPLVVTVKRTRLVLGSGMARKIMVS